MTAPAEGAEGATAAAETGWRWEHGLGVAGGLALAASALWTFTTRRKLQIQNQEITERLRREESFAKLGQRLTAATTLESAGEIVVAIADELIGWDAAYLRLVVPGGQGMVTVVHYDIVQGKRTASPGPPMPVELTDRDKRVMEHGQELILRKAPIATESSFRLFGDQSRPSASLMFAPMRHGTTVVGVLSLQSYTLEAYDEEDLRLTQSLADLSAATFERTQAKEALRASEARFRLLFESSPVGIAVSRESGLLYANKAHQRMFGYADFAELKGKSFRTLVSPDHWPAVEQRLNWRKENQRTTDSYETVGRRMDGSEFFYHVEVATMHLDDGDATVAFLTDITKRKLVEEHLRESEERFAQVFHSTPVAVGLTNAATGQFVDVNETFLRLFEFRREQVIGKTAVELQLWAAPGDRPPMFKVLDRHAALRNYEAKFKTSTGKLLNTLVSVERVQIRQQACLLFITHDITDRLNLESQLRHSQKMDAIGQLAAGVAHDFNNILTVIQGHSSLLKTTQQLDALGEDSLSQVATSAERAARLTRQLLTFSRKQVMQPRPLDLNDVVNHATKMLQRLLGENIALVFKPHTPLAAIQADPGMMEQIVVNLAVNARDAMEQGGELTISTSPAKVTERESQHNPEAVTGDYVCLEVADTGSGMDATIRARIFEPFFTTKETGKGTGLGLATVYGIIKQHRGWIEVKTAPGEGSVFRVYLPCATRSNSHMDRPAAPEEVAGGKETILVVEDEQPLRTLVTHILKKYGYRVLAAEHGPEALSIWEKDGPSIDLLLTDMVMPEGMSGWELARELKADREGLKVIYTSGYSADLFGDNCELREGVNFLGKPYQPQALAKAVRDCLDAGKQT